MDTMAKIQIVRAVGEQRPTQQADGLFRLYSPLSAWRGTVEVNRNKLFEGAIQPGMLRLIAPEESEHTVRSTPATALLVQFSEEHLQTIFARFEYQHTPAAHVFIHPLFRRSGTVLRLVREVKYARAFEGPARRCFLDGIAQALVGVLIDFHKRFGQGMSAKELPTLTDRQWARCCAYADERLHKKLSLKEWADSAGLSVSDFARRFERKSAETPYAWFMGRRIDRAKGLLVKTSLSLSDLACTLGFSSQSHFTEAFRVRAGSSPARWRTNYLKQY